MASNGRQSANLQLLAALASGSTWQEASAATGLSQRTIARRLKEAQFKAALDRRKDQILTASVAKLVNATTKAVGTLDGLLGSESHSVRLGAARSILELSVSMRTTVEITGRITALEEKLNEEHR